MTRDECRVELERLGRGWNVALSGEQLDALYRRIQHVSVQDWAVAVDTLLAEFLQAPRTGFLDHVLKAVEDVREQRRRAEQYRERQQAGQFMAGRIPLTRYADPLEAAYHAFRSRLLIESIGHGLTVLAQRHAAGLAAYLDNPTNARWAAGWKITDCGFHPNEHKLSTCIADEIAYWERRLQGQTEAESREAIAGVNV